MLRIISRLDIKNGVVIKGIHLEGQRKIGAPIELATSYYEQGIDEILFIDSVASLYGRPNLFHTVTDACKKVFVPITIGGGIRSIEHVEEAFKTGADKVAINTGFVRNPNFINEITSIYGSQSIVGMIEAKKMSQGWQVYVSNGREPTGLDVFEWACYLESQGIGELLITSVDQEGTQRGFDTKLYQELQKVVKIPIIACGGAGKISHLTALECSVKVQGIALASILHYSKYSLDEVKLALPRTSLRKKYVDIGLW